MYIPCCIPSWCTSLLYIPPYTPWVYPPCTAVSLHVTDLSGYGGGETAWALACRVTLGRETTLRRVSSRCLGEQLLCAESLMLSGEN